MAARQLGDQRLAQADEAIGRQDQAAVRCTREVLDCGLDVAGCANRESYYLHAKGWRRGLDRAHEEFRLGRRVWIEHDAHAGELGRNLLEQVEPLVADRELIHAEAGEIASRPCYVGDKTLCDRI